MLVDGTDDCRCVGHYESVERFLAKLKDIEPDVVLMDINLPGGLSGIEGVRRLKITHPKTQMTERFEVFTDESYLVPETCDGRIPLVR